MKHAKKTQTNILQNIRSYLVERTAELVVGAIIGSILTLVGTSVLFFYRFDPTVNALTETTMQHEERIDALEEFVQGADIKLNLLLNNFGIELP